MCLSLALASNGFIDGKSLGPFTPAPAGCFVTGASSVCESGKRELSRIKMGKVIHVYAYLCGYLDLENV